MLHIRPSYRGAGMHYKTSESTSMSYNQVIHDGDGEITRTPFF